MLDYVYFAQINNEGDTLKTKYTNEEEKNCIKNRELFKNSVGEMSKRELAEMAKAMEIDKVNILNMIQLKSSIYAKKVEDIDSYLYDLYANESNKEPLSPKLK